MDLDKKREAAAQIALDDSGQTDFEEFEEGWAVDGDRLIKRIWWVDENGKQHEGSFHVTFAKDSDEIVDRRWK